MSAEPLKDLSLSNLTKSNSVGTIAPAAAPKKVAYGADLDLSLGTTALTNTPFVWKKKVEQMIERGEKVDLSRSAYQARLEAKREDLIRLRERKAQREMERQKMQQLKEEIQKGLELEANLGWEDREEQFHRKQGLLRSEIRLREGRERPIDLLVKNIHILKRLEASETGKLFREPEAQLGESLAEAEARERFLRSLEVDAEEPSRLVRRLNSLDELKALKYELVRLVELGDHVDEYWLPLLIVCNHEIEIANKTQELLRYESEETLPSRTQIEAFCAVQGTRVQPVLVQDIDAMLARKSLANLDELDRHVQKMLSDSQAGKDSEYWEVVARRLLLRRAIATLEKFHTKLLKKRLNELRREAQVQKLRAQARSSRAKDVELGSSQAELESMVVAPESVPDDDTEAGHISDVRHTDAPPMVSLRDLTPEERRMVVTHEEDVASRTALLQKIHALRVERMVAEATGATIPILEVLSSGTTLASQIGGMDDFDGREEPMPESDLVAVQSGESSSALIAAYGDKYRPRKPRFINKVRTGYDWTKYNQAHYDKDNPPPRVVQGYRFNIFYPDLIDPSKTPTYRLEPDPDGNPDMCIIRFMAGPPYEDIAFKIVKKKWNTSRKHGFKCVFHKGVLTLAFNFMRVFYRR